MNLSIFSSNTSQFWFRILAFYLTYSLAVALAPIRGIEEVHKNHSIWASEVGDRTDFILVGDSRVGPFQRIFMNHCSLPGFDVQNAMALSGDSVTPTYHYVNLKSIREETPNFNPRLVVLFVGANNLNVHGLHVIRDYAFDNFLSLEDIGRLSFAAEDPLIGGQGIFSRLFPIYGKRIPITHLQVGTTVVHELSGCSNEIPQFGYKESVRNAIIDRNYLDIYRRNVYKDFAISERTLVMIELIAELVRSWGGELVSE